MGGGIYNTSSAYRTTVSGGDGNSATANYATVGGGSGNIASGTYSAVLGGGSNSATGSYSGAFGCGLTASSACTFYANNFCACGNVMNTGNLTTIKTGGGGTYKQVLVGQTTAAASGTAKKIAYVGHTHSVRIYVWANQSAGNGSSAIADIATLYGSSSGGTTVETNFGTTSDIVITYDNGGSPAYTINVTVVYTGTTPTINYVVEGINNDNSMYTI